MTIPDAVEIVAELERLLPDWIDMEPGRWQRVEYALRAAEGSGPVFPTFESFIAWVDEDTSAEWVEGEVYFMSPSSLRHQLIAGFLYKMIGAYVEHQQLGTTLNAPFKMKIPGYGAEPDVLVILRENEGRLRKTFLDGPADLVVEVISPESVERDRVKKFGDYQTAGIPEYWLIDPERRTAEFYQLEDGRYELAATPDDIYESRVLPGLRLPLEWRQRNSLPPLLEVLGWMGMLPS
jgi:Uma2 family endonuclease